MPILHPNQNIISLKASASLSVEYIYYAINTILFARGFSSINNFTLQYHYDVPIWILTGEKLSLYFKPQLKSLREMLVHGFIRKIILYLRDVETNKILERWDFVVECEEHKHNRTLKNDLIIQKDIRDVLHQISSTVNRLPILIRDWKYTITVKLEEQLMSNIEALKIPKIWFKNKNSWDI